MSSVPSGRSAAPPERESQAVEETALCAEAIEFVRFCHRRSGATWPDIYDEMCAVAARGSFRGMGYDELGELGVSFGLTHLAPLARATAEVVDEDRRSRPNLAGQSWSMRTSAGA